MMMSFICSCRNNNQTTLTWEMNLTRDATDHNFCLGRGNNSELPAVVLGRTGSPNHALATSLARGTHQSVGWSRFLWLSGMAGLALVTPRTVVQGGHCLAVKTMIRFNPSSPNKDECCGWGWLPSDWGWLRSGRFLRWASLAYCLETRPRG
jgi:hypothetical protein